MTTQVLLLQTPSFPAHEPLDHRTGLPTALLSDGSDHDPGRGTRRAALNGERQRKGDRLMLAAGYPQLVKWPAKQAPT